MTTGKKIKLLRMKKNLLKDELSQICSVSPPVIGYWESGARNPTQSNIEKLESYFGNDWNISFTKEEEEEILSSYKRVRKPRKKNITPRKIRDIGSNKNLGEKIKYLRKKKNLLQKDLADDLGLSTALIVSHWETGYRNPGKKMLQKIIDYFGTDEWNSDYQTMDKVKSYLKEIEKRADEYFGTEKFKEIESKTERLLLSL